MGAAATGGLLDMKECSCAMSVPSRAWALNRWKLHQAPEEQPGARIRLNLYDLFGTTSTQMLNEYLRPLNAGVFHCGVEVYGLEWSFGSSPQQIPEWHPVFGDTPSVSGVYKYYPRTCMDHTYCETIDLGRTTKSQGLVLRHLRAMRHEWLADEYDLLERNCCHFSVEFCRRLGATSIPEKVLMAPKVGKACRDCLQCKQDSCWKPSDQSRSCQCHCPCTTLSPTLLACNGKKVAVDENRVND
mmetsp:Transcript_4423/g.10742  ORF Transcript_4423/g.10742 Transcript_4423/m.10742 type:complete len:243 (+) Transcript_4423:140-868(+)